MAADVDIRACVRRCGFVEVIMGCDIHAMIEVKVSHYEGGSKWWTNAGDPIIGRNYKIFSVLANVRNPGNIPFISEPRGIEEEEASNEFESLLRGWGANAHSTSYVTLREMKEYNADLQVYSDRLVLARDKNGKITETCAGTSGEHWDEVGMTNVFGPWGNGEWLALIQRIERQKEAYSVESDEDVRLVFFFDN